MERRYLAATLALAATFAMFSGEFCTRYLSKVPHSPAELKAEIACARSYVAKQLMSKLESYTGRRAAAKPPMLAELTIPERPEAPEAALAAVPPPAEKCPARPLRLKAPQQVIQMRVMTGDAMHNLNDLSVVRAELLSDRGQQWQTLANQRALEINMKALEGAQHISVRAMEKAQREIEKSFAKQRIPAVHSTPIHINFATPASAPEAPEPPTPTIY